MVLVYVPVRFDALFKIVFQKPKMRQKRLYLQRCLQKQFEQHVKLNIEKRESAQ